MKTAWLFLLVLPVGRFSAQTTAIFEGQPGGVGDVLVLGATEVRTPELQGILLLPVDCIGRTPATELRSDHARLRNDVPGATRLSLPSQAGSLYKFRRANTLGGADFGYFVVTPKLEARCVLQLRGVGPLQIDDPIPGKVAVSTSGTALLIATTPEAGGNAWEVDLVNGSPAVNRTSLIEELAFSRNGLFLAEGWGFALTPTGAYRFERTVAARAEPVMIAESPAWFGTDVVASADGSTVAFAAGDDPTRAHIYVCRSTGPASRVTETPGPIAGAGFLPERTLGPTMALSTDGSHVAWCTSGAWTECFTRETDSAVRHAEVQVTRAELFHDTLNETGVISFFDPDSFVFTVGWREASEMARADVYRADMDAAGTLSVTNLTGTSGLLVPPFDYGTLGTAAGIRQTPDGQAWISLDPGLGRLLWIDSAGQAVQVLDRVTSIERFEPAGDFVVVVVQRPVGVDFPDQSSLELVQIPAGGVGASILVAPKGSTILHSQGWHDHNLFAAILDLGAGEWLGRISVPSSTGLLVSNQVLDYGLTQSLAEDGSIFSSVSFAGGMLYFDWSGVSTAFLYSSTRGGFILPGI